MTHLNQSLVVGPSVLAKPDSRRSKELHQYEQAEPRASASGFNDFLIL